MLQDKLVSVIMPVYNAERYLKEAVDSILQQSYRNFEFIIINDGSSDDSAKILDAYDDKRIKRVSFEHNKGLIEALNTGIKLAEGHLVARMDADDISLPKRLEVQVAAFQNNPLLLACDTDYYNLFEDGSRKLSPGTLHGDALKASLLFTTCFCHPAVMMRNVFANKANVYNAGFTLVEDYKLWCDLAADGEFEHISEPLLLYRSHLAQVSNQHHQTQLAKSAQIRHDFLNGLDFTVDSTQLACINSIGNNEFIRSKETLLQIEKTLLHLIKLNSEKRRFKEQDFLLCMHKFWLDSCGHGNLGLFAFSHYLKSPLSRNFKQFGSVLKLAIKCLLRSRKK